MAQKYLLSCESTVDMPYSVVHDRGIQVLFYTYSVDGVDYTDDMCRDPEALKRFYGFIAAGKVPKTSQINVFQYAEYFRPLLEQGDVLHINFGSGMTPSVNNAMAAAAQLREEFPHRRIEVVDSLCSSSGYGLLVEEAADRWEADMDMDELIRWLEAHRNLVHHQFFTSDIQYFRRSGRVSGPAAAFATILNICPILRLNAEGRIIAYDKVRGKKNAIRTTLEAMKRDALGGTAYDGKAFICHADALPEAEELRRQVEESFPKLKGRVRIYDIGTIIASHCGPGTVAVFFMGTERPL